MIMETLKKRNIIRNTNFEAIYILFNGQYINQDYFDDNYKKCEDCGEYHENDEMTDVGGSSEYKWICESCLDDYGFCECCNQYTHTDNMVRCDWCGEYICNNCSHEDNNNTVLCESCIVLILTLME
ncbi:MAG: hypothetical protein LLF98_02280 [Clostridium sp.]|uniref:hypothetical protein n=1 Tax=Clostridium sp. TaxID=1506 RepID=UPI0025C242FA|nr:hypothetical protein [Clostridium sp.]MCE5220109.1 hypothetical protein [Clostridium sp.]